MPPHPDTVSGEGVDPLVPLPASATPMRRLAVLRKLLAANRSSLDVRRAIQLLGGLPTLQNNGVVDRGAAEQVTGAAGDVLGWRACESWGRWEAVLRLLGAEPRPEWTAGLPTRALAAAAQAVGKLMGELTAGVATMLATDVANLTESISVNETEECELVDRMLAERARAAAAVYADERAAATVAKVERHLGREH